MPTKILMPALSPTMKEGRIAKWCVSTGDAVQSGTVLAEIETDKAIMEFEAIDDGTIGRLLVASGDMVEVNAPIALLLEEGENASALERDSAAQPAETKTQQQGAGTSKPEAKKDAGTGSSARRQTGEQEKGEGRILASPLAKRLASQQGFDLRDIKGSGPRRRIVKRDIESHARSIAAQPSAKVQTSTTRQDTGFDPRLYAEDSYSSVPTSGMQKVIAERLHRSFNLDVPHFPLLVDVRLDELLRVRALINAQENQQKISVNDMMIRAAAFALMRVPACNVSYDGDRIIQHAHADIGVAVAIDGGLITPILRKAETLSLSEIALQMKDYAARARARKLLPREFQGGSFSLSNLGMFKIKSFASIVNQPHGAILSIGAGEKRPIVGQGDQIMVATLASITLTCDHRVVDGATGARFLGVLKQALEEPSCMLA